MKITKTRLQQIIMEELDPSKLHSNPTTEELGEEAAEHIDRAYGVLSKIEEYNLSHKGYKQLMVISRTLDNLKDKILELHFEDEGVQAKELHEEGSK